MKYTFVILALLCFGVAFWSTQHIASDIQIIILLIFAFAGFVFIGFAAVLNELGKR